MPAEDDDLLPRLFRVLGPSPALAPELKRSWETTFSRELAAHNAQRRRQRRGYFGAACAATLLLVATYLYVQRDAPYIATPIAHVVSVAGSADAVAAGARTPLREGTQLHSEQTVQVGRGALLAIRLRGADVRLNSDTAVVLHATRLQVLRGQIYVDAGATHPGPTLEIETPLGTLAHVGTQFVVSVTSAEMRAAVREGSIAVNAAGRRRIVSAVDGAQELTVTLAGAVTTAPIAGTGGIWTWVVDAAPRYTMDGRNADEFLVWAARQLGAQLHYTNDATRVHAQTVVLHGDVRTLAVVHGLEILSATTDLDVDRSNPAVVRVSTR
jgi:ferric-dicitrate binding protein FerR (iron transport regulator)